MPAKAPASSPSETSLYSGYTPEPRAYDEFFSAPDRARKIALPIIRLLDRLGRTVFRERQKLADSTFLQGGITFSVYSDTRGGERIFPFDLVPRLVQASEWRRVDAGLKQRVHVLNLFLQDIYGPQRILREGVIPREMVEGSKAFLPKMRGISPPKGIYVHIAGIDLIRDAKGRFTVLEDNVRTPSGVSYVLENRMVMKKVLPYIFSKSRVAPVEGYPAQLRKVLASVAPGRKTDQHQVVLTPGRFNSAYFEHSFLARRMGIDLVEGPDLYVDDDKVFARTTRGPSQVHTIYRRIDDPFLDPEVFRNDSLMGVKGLVRAYAKGNVALANAIGNGVADDKAIYPYVPDMCRFYLGEEPILPQVPTYICERKQELDYACEHLHQLVVKSVNEAGGYGMLMGPSSSRKEIDAFRRKMRADPRNFIAQPLIELSTCPTWTPRGLAPRRVDLRPYVLTGAEGSWVLPGGLTRVALVKGSYVVNSSQGGGSKDTWILEER